MLWTFRIIVAAMLAWLPLAASAQVSQIDGVPTAANFWAPMTFALGPQMPDGRQRVYAIGSIDAGTADTFEHFATAQHLSPGTVITFHSPGGNAGQGLALGIAIRNHAFDTTIAQPGPAATGLLAKLLADRPGLCASSCAFAFLGGVYRVVPTGSLYGVHDTEMEKTQPGDDLLDLGQKIAGDITLYLNQMGVDPRLLTVLTKFNSNQGELFFMPADMMAELNVTTTSKTAWSLRNTQWGFGLEGRNSAASNLPGSSERIILACTGTPRHMVMGASYLPEARMLDSGHGMVMLPGVFASTVSGYAIMTARGGAGPVSSHFATLPVAQSDVAARAHVTDAHTVTAFVKLSPFDVAALRSADIVTFRFNTLTGGGGVTVDFAGGREQAMQLVQNCR